MQADALFAIVANGYRFEDRGLQQDARQRGIPAAHRWFSPPGFNVPSGTRWIHRRLGACLGQCAFPMAWCVADQRPAITVFRHVLGLRQRRDVFSLCGLQAAWHVVDLRFAMIIGVTVVFFHDDASFQQ